MADETREVSVVIPCYNCADTIAASISSALQQNYDAEIIVVDDGSSDQSAEIAASLGVEVLVRPHKGAAAARNAAIEHARGRYIAFLDADDVWTDNSLPIRMDLFHHTRELGLVCSDLEIWQADTGTLVGRHFDGRRELAEMEREQIGPDTYVVKSDILGCLLRRSFISTITVILPKHVLQDVGGFDESLWIGEDTDLWLRIANRYPIAYTMYAAAIYRQQSGSITKNLELTTVGLLKLWLKFRRVYAKQYPNLHELFTRNVGSYAYEAGLIAMKRGDMIAARAHFTMCIRNMPLWKSAWINCLRTYLPTDHPINTRKI